MAIIKTLRSSKWEDWKEALTCLLFTFVGSLVPVWGGAILIRLFSRWTGWFEFFRHGEFSIYSASLLSSTLYLMVKGTKELKATIIWPIIGLLISAFLFAGVTSKNLFSSDKIILDEQFLFNFSWPLFSFSVLSFFFINLFINIHTSADVKKMAEEGYENLESNFDKLGRE